MSPRPAPRRGGPPKSSGPRRQGAAPSSRHRDGVGGDQVEGRRAVLELLRARRRHVRRIVIADQQDPAAILDEIEREAQRQRVGVQLVSMARLDREAKTEGHQGVIAYAENVPTVGLESLTSTDRPFLLVCDGVTDPRNLGAMLRSADGAGVTGVVLPRHRSARLSPTVTKTAAGAIEYLNFCDVGGVPAALQTMEKEGIFIVGLAGESSTSLYDLDLGSRPVALVVGSEEKGLASLTRRRCSVVASIPQMGRVESLNAGVAVSIAAFEVARQRRSNS